MATPMDEVRATLRQLREKLAFEAPRAGARAGVPPELVERLRSTLAHLIEALNAPTGLGNDDVLHELYEDAIVEGHLVLHDWERWLGQNEANKGAPRPTRPAERRQHPRQELGVTVTLLRHSVRENEREVTLASETASRRARNVSLGGIFVAMTRDELAFVSVGSVLHVSVAFGELSFKARAVVTRRDGEGVGLRWLDEDERVKRAIKQLLDALRRG